VFYSSLFHQSSFGSNYNPGIDPNTASILQTVASSIVLDSLSTWQLVHPDSTLQASVAYSSIPGASLLSFTATANQDANFTWYFPDMTIEIGAIIGFEYNLSTYQVMLIAEGLCDTDTVLIDVNNSSAGLSNASQIQWKVTGPQQIELYGTLIGAIEAFDVVGKTQNIMQEEMANGSRITFPVNTSFLRVQTPNEATTIRIPYLLN
jgi:hypothetical protein